ncbi:hypothetical protein KY327_00090 [Candidatus Woesearchaeota archaeon]|nr:hypothetical protein [Candidatus Woesearchaeota archaeon]
MEEPQPRRGDQLRFSYADLQLKQARNQLYTIILMMFGTVSLILGIILVVANNMNMRGESAAAFVIGFTLFASGYLWKEHDQKRVERKKDELESWKDSDEEVQGIKRV